MALYIKIHINKDKIKMTLVDIVSGVNILSLKKFKDIEEKIIEIPPLE